MTPLEVKGHIWVRGLILVHLIMEQLVLSIFGDDLGNQYTHVVTCLITIYKPLYYVCTGCMYIHTYLLCPGLCWLRHHCEGRRE